MSEELGIDVEMKENVTYLMNEVKFMPTKF
jgi:hypothetical protein